MDYTKIIEAIVLLLLALAEAFLVPFIKGKIESNKRAELLEYVTIAVQAAEQIFGGQHGAEKKAYVMDYLNSKGIKFDADTIDMAIESAVLEMTNALLGE